MMMSKAGSTFSFHEDDLDFIGNYNKLLDNLILRGTPTSNDRERDLNNKDYRMKDLNYMGNKCFQISFYIL